MLNYILPPIIIIISVSVLIMFLFRKAAQIPAADFVVEQEKSNGEKARMKIMSVIGNFSLKFLERLIHRSKLLSLKFHNMSNEWFQVIREKRQRAARLQKEAEERIAQEESVQADVFQQDEISQPRRAPRPMVASRVTLPQQEVRMKEKNKLEDALIKRIAVNPKDIEAYERLGDYYLESENFQDSLECFKQVLRLSPTHQKARLRIRRLERLK
ncbi:MAG: tetratricopeptide repeat protein [Candidatus Moranbacteria bacterium]|nr:tetratricopeptide repeat protein [Candidatus Moranbacteria bacterium]